MAKERKAAGCITNKAIGKSQAKVSRNGKQNNSKNSHIDAPGPTSPAKKLARLLRTKKEILVNTNELNASRKENEKQIDDCLPKYTHVKPPKGPHSKASTSSGKQCSKNSKTAIKPSKPENQEPEKESSSIGYISAEKMKKEKEPHQDSSKKKQNCNKMSKSSKVRLSSVNDISEPKQSQQRTVKRRTSCDDRLPTASSVGKSRRKKADRHPSSGEIKDLSAAGDADGPPDIAALLRLGEGDRHAASDSDNSDWEAVDVKHSELTTKGFVEVTLSSDLASELKKRKKRELDPEAYLRRRVAAARRAAQALMHRVHLLCLVSRALQLNALLNRETLLAVAMSMLPSSYAYPPERVSRRYVEQFVKWFCAKVPLVVGVDGGEPTQDVFTSLEVRLRCRTARTPLERVCLFVLILRAIGVDCRLVLSLQPTPLRPGAEPAAAHSPNATKQRSTSAAGASERTKQKKNSNPEKTPKSTRTPEANHKRHRAATSSARATPAERPRRPPARRASVSGRRKSAADLHDADASSGEEFLPSDSAAAGRPDRRVLSSDSSAADGGGGAAGDRRRHDHWAEVFVEEEQRWLCVDVDAGAVDCVDQIRKRATHPLAYVLGCDNAGHLKDVTARYEPRWHTAVRRLRVPADWWAEAVGGWRPPRTSRDRREDEQLESELQQRPLPQAISEYKDHPLYALQRHLLKFEAIYPPSAVPLGYMGKGDRKEAVYARQCVHVLHSRETWIKQARTVKDGEQPYKIVKARPKWDRVLQRAITDRPLEVFGRWQTAEYVPPRARDGLVPRNGYGNVELFQPSMLPGGTVHLPLDGLSRVAKKLGIDCAPAMVGWDYHCGGSHPVFDGFVVCEEFAQTLTDAWHQEQQEAERRQRERREKRALDNWARLVRALRIRARLAVQYSFSSQSPVAAAAGPAAQPTHADQKHLLKQQPTAKSAPRSGKTAVSSRDPVKEEPSSGQQSLEAVHKARLDAAAVVVGALPAGRPSASSKLAAQRAARAAAQPAGGGGERAEEAPRDAGVQRALAGLTFSQLALSSDSERSDDDDESGRGGSAAVATPAPAAAAEPTAARPPAAPVTAARLKKTRRPAAGGKRRSPPAPESERPPAAAAAARARRRSRRAVNYQEAAGSDAEQGAPVRDDDFSSDDEQPFVKAARRAESSDGESD